MESGQQLVFIRQNHLTHDQANPILDDAVRLVDEHHRKERARTQRLQLKDHDRGETSERKGMQRPGIGLDRKRARRLRRQFGRFAQ